MLFLAEVLFSFGQDSCLSISFFKPVVHGHIGDPTPENLPGK
jgi:hypothetical protein